MSSPASHSKLNLNFSDGFRNRFFFSFKPMYSFLINSLSKSLDFSGSSASFSASLALSLVRSLSRSLSRSRRSSLSSLRSLRSPPLRLPLAWSLASVDVRKKMSVTYVGAQTWLGRRTASVTDGPVLVVVAQPQLALVSFEGPKLFSQPWTRI